MYRNVYKTLARGRYPPVNNRIIRMCIHQASGNISEDDCISRHYFCDKSLDCFKIFITIIMQYALARAYGGSVLLAADLLPFLKVYAGAFFFIGTAWVSARSVLTDAQALCGRLVEKHSRKARSFNTRKGTLRTAG